MADSLDWAKAVESQEHQQVTSGVGHLSVSEPPGLMEDDVETTKAEASLLTKILRTKLIENTHDVQVQQNDPNSPLFSAKTFEELRLNQNLLKGIYGMGFNKPSKIQETALPLLLADPPQNLIAQSQSGTGKTAAFVLAMLSRVDPSNNYPQVNYYNYFNNIMSIHVRSSVCLLLLT
jgi:ATP-dependent RNA helicase DDX19/DBP5